MIASIRKIYNTQFSLNNYQALLNEISEQIKCDALDFRVAETPIFIDKEFKNKIIDACESIVDVIVQPNFINDSFNAIPKNLLVPNDKNYSDFIAFDFGICENEHGELEPQLIEMQGFPTLFAYQLFFDKAIRNHFTIPENYSSYFNGFNSETYIKYFQEIIVGNQHPENVILLEIFPHQQKTRIDFYATEKLIGIKTVCLTELINEKDDLFYLNNGVKTKINKIYNRIIFDELQQQSKEIQELGKKLFTNLNVEWAPHPNWFYRISKYTLPFLNHPYIPKTYFLNEVKEIPVDLENYVLKPLFSFAGQGVVIDVSIGDIDKITDPENWILQRKVKYAEIIKTLDVNAKAEIRIFYFWKKGEARPIATSNLARLSKGKMVGVRYNKDKEWVGGTIAYFEE